ncbi:MAG TPA: hypothetical protein VES67_04425 [Vicinamibacterales bacterium]|nr:hypothetical protein [Vicinamibacterales bacterium]
MAGHTDTRMLARYTHPIERRKIEALVLPWVSTERAQNADDDAGTPRRRPRLPNC